MKHTFPILLSVILTLSLAGCGISQSEFDEAVAEAREEGYDAGYNEGYDAGYSEGEDAGYNAGYDAGWDEGTITGAEDGYSDGYLNGILEYIQEVTFFRNNACIVTTAGSKYHHWGCYHIAGRRYYIYNIELAQSKGYTPCLDCWESGLIK